MEEKLYLWKQQQQQLFVFQSHKNIAQSFLNTSNQSKHTIQKTVHRITMCYGLSVWHYGINV